MALKRSTARNEPPPTPVVSLRYPLFTRLDHNRATIEEFDREHMGVAAKE
jgi:hypothetical protein